MKRKIKKCVNVFLLFMLGMLVSAPEAFSQSGNISVRGNVKDNSNEPVISASVVVKGTTNGIITDLDGNYQINNVPSNGVLVFSFLGYRTVEIPVAGKSQIDVVLQDNTELLDEVVVIGYGSVKKSDLTGSIAAIGEKEFNKGLVTTPTSLISGKVAGVQIVSNGGRAGEGNTIRIRSGASLNASNDPLIVIDGVPVDNGSISGITSPLSSINPNDIESMNILKDASATAIYGSRASNGVILITTKKGTAGQKLKFNISTQNSIATIARRVDVLSADELRDLVTNSPNVKQQYIDYLGDANTDWQDEIFRSAFTTDNNISISGSIGKALPFRLSAGFMSQDGILDTDNMKRTTVGLSLSPTFLDKHLSVNINLKGTYAKTRFGNGDAIGSALRMDPTQPVKADGFDELNGYWGWLLSNGNLNGMATDSPVALLQGKDDQSDVYRSIGNIQFDYKMHFLPELRANLNLGYDLSKGEGNVVTQPWSPAFYTKNEDSGERSKYKQEKQNLLMEFYLNYAKNLNEANHLEVMAGYTYQDWLTKSYNYPKYYFDETIMKENPPAFEMDKPQNTLISYYGRLNYTLLSRYMLTATLRTDGSSRFAPENRWGTFPSVALAWRINEESFMKEMESISNLKLRLGWGITGQQEVGNYEYLAKYSYSQGTAQVQFGDQFYHMYRPDGYDANRVWETTTTYNAGLDYGFLNNRIYGSIDAYIKNTKDLLNNTPLAMGSNFTNTIIQNIGKMQNKGIELSVNAVPIDNNDMHWDLGFNITYNKSEVTQLTMSDGNSDYIGAPTGGISGGTGNTAQMHSVGYTPFTFYVYKQLYTPDGKPIDGGYADLNGDGLISDNDKYHFHSALPDYYMGFNTTFSYKGWSLATALRASVGNYIFDNTAFDMGTMDQVLNPNNFLMNTVPDVLNSNFYIKQNVSDYFVHNASFLKMDYLQLSYNFGRMLKKVNLTANATVQNVFTLTKYKGVDPEIQSGIDNNFYPNPRTFSLGLNLNF
ncbi:SusC/RagA family TonB-linked outer membrane protein [Dysgonomonas reticulitermitis]